MRITEFDLEIEDIEWYAVDENSRIAQFTSGGSKMVPDFICESRERLDEVCEYFDKLNKVLSEEIVFSGKSLDYPRKECLKEYKSICKKGIYCYDISDGDGIEASYELVCKPIYEILVTDLPYRIQELMANCQVKNINFNESDKILVKNIY